ncbi:hypothetical protein ACYOEI_02270 [Singulisphaera rosea]
MSLIVKPAWRPRMVLLGSLVLACGCGEDSGRVAGSIDIPKASLKSFDASKKAPNRVKRVRLSNPPAR